MDYLERHKSAYPGHKGGLTKLHYFAKHNEALKVADLLKRNDADLSKKDNNGFTPLDWAIKAGHLATLRIVLLHLLHNPEKHRETIQLIFLHLLYNPTQGQSATLLRSLKEEGLYFDTEYCIDLITEAIFSGQALSIFNALRSINPNFSIGDEGRIIINSLKAIQKNPPHPGPKSQKKWLRSLFNSNIFPEMFTRQINIIIREIERINFMGQPYYLQYPRYCLSTESIPDSQQLSEASDSLYSPSAPCR